MRNLKKVIALVAVFAMMVSTVAFAQTYSDVAETDVFAEAVETLSALGILTGDDADEDGVMDFRPADTITRAEVAAIICRIQNLNAAASSVTPFDDVPASHWASGYVAQAAGQGIINGYGDGNFGPDDNVTYEQAIKMLMETLGYRLFAEANGGYPSGYLAAAQRYEVLDGVVGGGVGTEANRGMVAQLVYNAIDTPMMEQTVYGTDNNWEILDGGLISGTSSYRQFLTLLKRDLKVYKASGTVVANSLSNGPDKEKVREIVLAFDNADTNGNYFSKENIWGSGQVTVRQEDIDADDMLGYNVTLFTKKNLDGTFSLINVAKASSNQEISFTLDLYAGINATDMEIEYLKDANSSTESKAKLQKYTTTTVNGTTYYDGLDIIINGIMYTNANTDLSNLFANGANGAMIAPYPNDKYSGKVTLINNDTDAAYDVLSIEIATTAVVNKVSGTGMVSFLGTVPLPKYESSSLTTENLPYLEFENEATDYIINLTKDGEAIDFSELAKWDVLSIVNANRYNVYDVEVLGDTNTIDAYVQATRTNSGQTEYKLSDGNWYKVAQTGYRVTGLKTGDAGRFYVDAYGKIVALDDDVVVEGVEGNVADNYAVVLQTNTDKDTWGNDNVFLQLLTKTGDIVETQFADNVKTYNLNKKVGNSGLTGITFNLTDNSATIKDTDITTNATTLKNALVGQMISYSLNSAGALKSITLPQADDEEALYTKFDNGAVEVANRKYDADEMELGGIQLEDDTLVFYITNSANTGNLTGYGVAGAKADYSRVATAADLAHNDAGYLSAVFDYADDIAKAVIVYNTTGEISDANSVAVIESVGKTVVNGYDDVKIVEFWQNGELQTATTAVDMTAFDGSVSRGDVFKVQVSNGIITAATQIMDYTYASITDGITNGPLANISYGAIDPVTQTGTMFGAITNVSDRGKITLSKRTGVANVAGSIGATDAEIANVYVMDPNKRDAAQLYVSSIGDAFVDDRFSYEELSKLNNLSINGYVNGTPITITADGATELFLYQHAFAYQYDGDVIDIVIYKPYKFTK